MAQAHENTEVPNLLTSENVNLEVSSTIQPAGESEASLQEAENACEMQNSVLSPKRANEHETHKPERKRKKQNKRSLTDACEVTTSASHLESEHTDTETTQHSKIDNKTTDYSADTEDMANFQKSTSRIDNLEDAVGDDHSPKSTDKNQMPDSHSSVKEEPNSGLESSKSGIIPSENEDQGARATVEKPAPHPQMKKSTDSKEGIILTLEKQKENNGNVESAKEVHGGKSEAAKDNAGSDLECTGASKEKICNQQNTKKEESIPLTKGEDSGADNKKKRLQQSEKKRQEQECKTVEEKHIDKPSESPKQESNQELSMTTISNSAAADKTSLTRKEKKQQKKHSKETTSGLSYTNLKPEETVSIYFHAILSKDFKFNPFKDKVVIRSGSLADNWATNVLEMNVTKDLGEHGYFIEGCHSVHKDKIQKQHPYKYVVIRDNINEYEFIYKSDSPKDCITNRCLVINQHLLYEREWHQYDDIICAPHDKSWTEKFLSIIRSGKNDIKRGKQLAGEIMMDSIFEILTTWNEKNLKNFLRQLQQFNEVYKNPMVFEGRPVTWFSLSFGMKDVQVILKDALKKMARHPNNQVSETKTHDVQSRLRTGILILVLSDLYGLEWSNYELAEVCEFFSVQLLANITVEFKTLKESFYFEQRIPTILKQMMVRCIDNKIIGWVQVIPVLHLFVFSSNIASPVFLDNSQTEERWAGLDGLPFITFRQNINDTVQRELLELMSKSKHLMEVDRLLARSWFTLLPSKALPDYLKMVTPNLLDVLQGIIQRLKTRSISMESLNRVLKLAEETVCSQQNRDLCDERLEACVKVSLKIHEIICKLMKKEDFTETIATSVVLISKIAKLKKSSSKVAGEHSQREEDPGMPCVELTMTLTTTREWLKAVLSSKSLLNRATFFNQDEFHVWITLTTLDLGNTEWTSFWMKGLLSELEGRMKKEKPIQQIEIYCKKIEEIRNLQPLIAECFEKCALDAVYIICQDKSEAQLLERLWNYNLTKFGKLVSTIIENSWEKDYSGMFSDDPDSVLQHLLNWSAAKTIFQLLGIDNKVTEQLSNKAKDLMALAVQIFQRVMRDLLDGSIKIKYLEWILKKKDNFMALHKTKQGESFKEINLRQVLTWRQKELNRFFEERNWVDSFLKMCHKIDEHVKVAIDDLKNLFDHDVREMKLNEVVMIEQIGAQYIVPYIPMVSYFSLSEEIKQMASAIDRFKDSYILQMCWEKEAHHIYVSNEQQNEPPLSLEEACTMIWNPCFDQYKDIFVKVKEASLTFAEVDNIFKDYHDRYEELRSDFKIMCRIDGNTKDNWIEERIRQIKEYHQLHLAVESAQMIAKVQSVLNLTGNFTVLETLLNVTNESYRDKSLHYINEHLIQAKNHLVEITKPRRKALKEFTQRCQFLQWVKEALKDITELKVFVDLASISAGENDLDIDRVACFHDAVLGYSSLLFEIKPQAGFDDFMHCVQKLWNALDNDPVLTKKLQDSARHLEWLKTVKESHGSIEQSSLSLASAINSNGIYIIDSQGKNKLSLGSAIILKLPEAHGDNEEVRSYTLEDLKELQNKLMLMSGKGDHGRNEVDRFVEVFANVQRLATSFISLFSAGNMLFRNWKIEVYCSRTCEACLIIDFNLKEVRIIKAVGKVTEQLPILCKKMEAYLEVWKQYMDKQRSQYYYLNFYTAEQIVYLSTQLFNRSCTKLDVLMMLSFIKPNCTAGDLEVAQQKLFDGDTSIGHRPLSDRKSCVQPFMMRQVDIQDIAMEETMDLVWKQYMENMTYFLSNCLDVSTLGKLLENVAEMKQTVARTIPPGFQTGHPNLVVCPHSELLTSALCIYMHSSNQPLPTYDEVLICTADTTNEQVELFLRRCLTSGCTHSKIYSLLYADELTYDVSVRFEELFKSLELKSQSDQYKLVILCNSEREHCYIPTALSRHKVHMIPQQPLKEIQSYLENHYRVSNNSSAATVFRDGMFVRIISSNRAGVGKSLYVKRLHEKLKKQAGKDNLLKTIHLLEPQVDENKVLQALFSCIKSSNKNQPLIFHFDIASTVQKGLCEFLFKLFILQYLMGTDEKMWKCSQRHLYVVEMLKGSGFLSRMRARHSAQVASYNFLDVFPKVYCRPPKEVLEEEVRKSETQSWNGNDIDPLMDEKEFRSESFQRPYQYLRKFKNRETLDTFIYQGTVEGNHVECLQLFLIYSGVMDPSWSELRNFAWFLNLQLKDCETSVFCNFDFIQDTLQGFKDFVVNFMILMAKDFATPSLNISDQSPGIPVSNLNGASEEDIAPFLLRKKWESEPHPYIFFNDDHISMTFIGFHLQQNGQGGIDAVDPSNGNIIKPNVMTRQLYEGLLLQKVPFNINFDELPRSEKIERLCMVLGIEWPIDPDETYELTTDNILKILAIHMRFRCDIPVIIMGETGCGKTRLIKFLCELRKIGADTENMKLVKVHGGTTADVIYAKIKEAEALAIYNKQEFNLDTILFFDEANTSEAVSCIKEVVCDHMIEGVPLSPNTGLQIIAACNPYRKHTDEMVKRLESAGLGYRVRADETEDKLGCIPLRQLVYRVQALPPSMIPLVWDFGQLDDLTEKMYIQQIVQRLTQSISVSSLNIKCMVDTLSASQNFMRCQQDECSFVSLRDVERCMKVFVWFYNNRNMLLDNLEQFLQDVGNMEVSIPSSDDNWPFVLALGVCYHACLEKKDVYRRAICHHLPSPYDDPSKFSQQLELFQDLLLSGAPLRETIARNSALKENVFMMVICIELKIPLFLVGKPGSSKSLAKTIVADAMQGKSAHSELYKKLKQIHLVSFQCSPHSTSEGIINTFKQCARFQEGKNLDEYVSVVVLDEIGLAEDSPKMPLKALHPLLEDGCIDDDPVKHKKVGFIGISNWALDPAKMNRGIFVSRGDPDKEELIESAKGISSSDPMIQKKVKGSFVNFADAYLKICKQQAKEFFGLRDYYSLIKMVFSLSKTSKSEPTPEQLAKIVLRNFSGSDDVNVMDVFKPVLGNISHDSINTLDLIKCNIYAADSHDMECRYLLILTKNFAALQILQQMFFANQHQPEIIFGSSFPKDQDYTQICRNINRVKICMETGQMVVLLNLQNLYESLYDALNQYYVYLGGQKYVDLGLGTHRVKCRVHPKFRLIVIEEKEVVYREFPIPLINRLEKHYLDINTVLDREQRSTANCMEKWVQRFTAAKSQNVSTHGREQKYDPSDVFVGYHSDTCASVVLKITQSLKQTQRSWEDVRIEAQWVLLNCATPDSVVRLTNSKLPAHEADVVVQKYFEEQHHDSLADFIHSHIKSGVQTCTVFTEVTTYSRLLTASDIEFLQREISGSVQNIFLCSLQQFETEHSFLKKIRHCIYSSQGNTILLIQTDFENSLQSANLVASAKYSTLNEINKSKSDNRTVYIYFLTKLPRIEGGSAYIGFHGDPWQSVHIDDLRKSKDMFTDLTAFKGITISQLFGRDPGEPESMIVDQEEEILDKTKILDTTSLIRNCVQSAVSMLRDLHRSSSRSTTRVEILLSLLREDVEFKASFLALMKQRLHSLLVKRDEESFSATEWMLREASNVEALQEGGTFRHTLWKRIQTVVTPLLAQIISVIDRDCNLNLLRDDTPLFVRNLWMNIFNDANLLDLPYNRTIFSLESEIVVHNYMKMDVLNIGNELPFSWRIKEFLDELWIQAQYMEGQVEPKLNEIFNKTGFGKYFSNVNEEWRQNFFFRYLADFLLMTMNISTEVEFEFLQGALISCINQLKIEHNIGDEMSLLWVHVAYQHFKNRLQNFSRIIVVNPSVLTLLQKNKDKIQKAEDKEMVIDIYAAAACVDMLEFEHTKLSYPAWLQMVNTLQMPIELVCTQCEEWKSPIVHYVQSGWRRIFSLSLFVEHLILGVEEIHSKLQNMVVIYAVRLAKSLNSNSDLRSQDPFQAVIMILRDCKRDAGCLFFRYGLQECSVCFGELNNPVLLPCNHLYCLNCIKQWFASGDVYCPCCRTAVANDYVPEASEEISEAVSKVILFRKRCDAFFIALVSMVCFKDNSPPTKEVVRDLLSLLLFLKKTDSSASEKVCSYATRHLSPFDEAADQNPVVRSIVLKLLLKYSFDDIKNYLQDYLSAFQNTNIFQENETDLYALFLNCLEDSIYEKSQWCTVQEKIAYLAQEGEFLQMYIQHKRKQMAIEKLQIIARIRLCFDTASQLLCESCDTLDQDSKYARAKETFLHCVKSVILNRGNDWFKIYLVRKLCSLNGIEFVQELIMNDQFSWIFPKEVLQRRESTGQIDRYIACGKNYQTLRDALFKSFVSSEPKSIEEAKKVCKCSSEEKGAHMTLAIFREFTILYASSKPSDHPNKDQCDFIAKYIEEENVFHSRMCKKFAIRLLKNDIPGLEINPGLNSQERTIIEIIIHAAAVILFSEENSILTPLQHLSFQPALMVNTFLPTMPEDISIEARGWAALQNLAWYQCPNGHPCLVGECGRPVEVARCPECKVVVGGHNHNPVSGFTAAAMMDKTQTGHILGDPRKRETIVAPDRQMSLVSFLLVRLMTHVAMFIGTMEDVKSIEQIIKPQVQNPRDFLWCHIKKDVEQLRNSLAKTIDETAIVVHLFLHQLIHQKKLPTLPDLSTKAQRKNWESSISKEVITPAVENLDRKLADINSQISQDKRSGSDSIVKIVYGDPQTFLTLPKGDALHCSTIWDCRKRISPEHLRHMMENREEKENVPILQTFLQKEVQLRLVKYLPELLALQNDLTKLFQNTTEVPKQSALDFLQTISSEPVRSTFTSRISCFISVWNQLRTFLITNGEFKIPEEFGASDLDMQNCQLEVLLPRRQGLGLCSTALVSYLIALQNDFVYTVEKYTVESTPYSISPQDVSDLHVIRYEVGKDIIPLLLSNCQYTMEKGSEIVIEYDFKRIEQQLTNRFLKGKPLISLKGIPTLIYRQDRNYGIIFHDIQNRIPQESLPISVINVISGELQSYSEVCEAFTAVEVTSGFLAMSGGDPDLKLDVYLKDVLQMEAQTSPHVMETLRRCNLKHIQALWQLLSSRKSECSLILNRDPFSGIKNEYKEHLSEEVKKQLRPFFVQASVDTFILELHELLTLKCKNVQSPDSFNPTWSLKMALGSFMDVKEVDNLPELEDIFPETILMSQSVETWKAAVAFKREQLQFTR
ncbi:E3 ubiquitin-protein ligase rnf213-alpha isoform X2 [Leucoraja erinacea]|uniref:E3 ubiquitin-protein ligase rnf213-alpha isoform X2 n=1 Tax=Leucoraja erinaceus TaxID=7782 RepID=UPI002455DB30|nr:E3 ubiquitin-protein ligase rnf213-alpha isoform X2 [Leucoraja erinacea]